jgi:serpin B
MRPFQNCALVIAGVGAIASLRAADFDLAARATNQLGVDLHRQLAHGDDNLCLSPYSIESALAMTFAGADGETKTEMARVLHFPGDGDAIHASFATLQSSLNEITKKNAKLSEQKEGRSTEPITLAIANRLFGQVGYDFHNPFQELVKKFYTAPFEPLDFKKDPESARIHINGWVEDQTRKKIRDLIPINGVATDTRLVLANALYFKAQWLYPFAEERTKTAAFHQGSGKTVNVSMMRQREEFGYAKRDGFVAVALPYLAMRLNSNCSS